MVRNSRRMRRLSLCGVRFLTGRNGDMDCSLTNTFCWMQGMCVRIYTWPVRQLDVEPVRLDLIIRNFWMNFWAFSRALPLRKTMNSQSTQRRWVRKNECLFWMRGFEKDGIL